MAKRPVTKAAGASGMFNEPEAGVPEASRPATSMSRVLGQSRAVDLLRSAIKSERVHHAWIFHGPAGVGKFTCAQAFAAELLTPSAKDPLYPEVTHLLQDGAHPDLHVITKELASISRESKTRSGKQSNIAKDVIMEFFIEPLGVARTIACASRAGKVFIIDQAELLDTTGQNTILKVVEEPPAGTVLIFVTSDEHRLLPTIRSRCQRVAFGALDERSMQRWLDEANIAPTGEERAWLVKYAAGAPGALQLAISAGLYQWHAKIDPMLSMLASGKSAPTLGTVLASLVAERSEQSVKQTPEASKEMFNRFWAKRMLALLADRVRRDLWAGHYERALAWLELITDCERQIDSNVAFAAAFDNLGAQMAQSAAVAGVSH
jgi:DNA polymerase-3 subunit delta'